MRKIIVLFIAFIIFGVIVIIPRLRSNAKVNDSDLLSIVMDLPVQTIKLGETIEANITLKNISDSPLVVNKRLLLNLPVGEMSEMWFEIQNNEGKSLPLGVLIRVRLPIPSDFIVLQPDQSISDTYDLNYWYLIKEPGVYTVKAIYRNTTIPQGYTNVWTGEISSEVIQIEITE